MITSKMTAPMMALISDATKPEPMTMPIRGRSQPAITAPMMPTTMLPISPRPYPLTIRPAIQPASEPNYQSFE
jgi:hypothetical protein